MRIILLLLLLFSSLADANQILNVYNWADYLPSDVIKQFENETGIRVNYSEYDSNEMLYAKLKSSPSLGYDVIFPSSYYVQRMAKENMLLPLDTSKLTNLGNINKLLLHRPFDPTNTYSVPYTWGTTGIVVNKKFLNPKSITGWENFWDPKFRNQLLLFDDMREIFAIALFRLGYSVNETNPQHIEQAYQLLKKLWPNIKLFTIESEQNIYIDEDAYLGMALNGEIYNAIKENANLTYIYPKEGFEVWMDCIAIPKNAPHRDAALAFINFLMRPEVAAKIAVFTGFSTPNARATALLPPEMQRNPIVNPPDQIVQRGQFFTDLGPTNAIYESYWNKLKIGE